MYLQEFWDFRSNQRCQGRRPEVDARSSRDRLAVELECPTFQDSSFRACESDGRLPHGPDPCIFIGLKSEIGARVCLLGSVGPTSRTVALNLWSFGESELRKLTCPESVNGYIGASEDLFWLSWLSGIFLEGKR
ncbi:hypothetical protein PIB30_002898 [Stylosanthes scabra]|uniref:Uncharacterized protein n=1 Tax=Stylosanthes scabra TaxID=79078 RepID=A0ABU6U3D8_9FABA|nr:hypothetical protein [Stylosanthes scabra]